MLRCKRSSQDERNWNTDQCISAGGLGDGLKTYTCSTYGEFWDQWIKLDNKQLKLYSQNPRGRSGCIGAEREKGAEVTIEDCGVPGYRQSFRVDRETGGIIEVGSGECLTASHDHFELLPCEIDPESGKVFGEQAITFTELKSNRYQLRASEVGEVPLCADSSSGTKLVLYSCYNPKMRNNNQEWEFLERFSDLGSNIKFGGTKCMSVLAGAKTTRKVFYDTCVTNNGLPKPGQRFEKDYSDSKSEFALRDGNWCLDVNEEGGVQVASCDGSSSQKWRSEADQISALVNIETSMCLQGDKDGDLSMSSCSFSPGDSQRWNLAENLVRGGEEDACIDYKPVRTTPLSVVSCPRARSIKWSIYEPFEPLETRLYREARGKYPKLLAGEVSHTDAPEGNIIEV
ncbi:hypothetical protein FOL47_005644 [Perkinsus chesapeaki]|uniref:Ricin B lectin domain-containing protein n=1 Tax=Perkinsus chesapeaki TaxID=330153 RepID=A0A7J6LWE6_PERCH|nr:hypothetical protein FOL47_005644 [Perkinsus chesapeaki]